MPARRNLLSRLGFALAFPLLLSLGRGAEVAPCDLVIYGGTPAGVAAAVQAARMGKSVVMIEPTHRLGGMTTGGLGKTDLGNKAAIGGVAREFYQAIKKYYANPQAWKWQSPSDYKDRGATAQAADAQTMWTLEPGVALKIFEDWTKADGIQVVYGERLDRLHGVRKSGLPPRIESITMESGQTFRGRMFIDATYEGDLMAAAGVSYIVGREPDSQYGETCDGVQIQESGHHQLHPGVSPYMKKDDPSSGLLPFIEKGGPGKEGDGDHGVQAYGYRLCLTNRPENRIPFRKPEGYQAAWYELLFRNFEAGETQLPLIDSPMPNGKTDINNRGGVSMDFIGQSAAYPEASYAEREEIARRHRLYEEGLLWALANDPRVPQRIRAAVSPYGLCKDEFVENGGWPEQLYVREARRMRGDYVMTQQNCLGQRRADDSVGLASYGMDSHAVKRYVNAQGSVFNEGLVEKKGFPPYAISYRSLVPKEGECANLLVPVCLSATHIAYGSIRMEPVFMVLGQSAATAAALALEEGRTAQKVDMPELQRRLRADGQVLQWNPPSG